MIYRGLGILAMTCLLSPSPISKLSLFLSPHVSSNPAYLREKGGTTGGDRGLGGEQKPVLEFLNNLWGLGTK
jgi:hypothetical protein